MYFQKRGGRYSFIYYDTTLKKNVRLSRAQTPSLQSDEEAEAFCRSWSIKYDSSKVRISKRLQWKSKYVEFDKLLKAFERSRKEEAPYSWMNHNQYMQYYILPFFLDQKDQPNPDLWHYHFEDFRQHLETISPIKTKKKKIGLAYSTINHIIKSLNSFMTILKRRCLIETAHRCRTFSQSKIKTKQEECIIPTDVGDLIHLTLKEIHPPSADLFSVSLRTGLRLNEMMGLSLNDVFEGDIDNEALKKVLEPYQMPIFGYISLESQPALKSRLRDDRQRVPRKPLKGRRRIDAESGRIIPIFSVSAWKILANLWNAQHRKYLERRFGPNPSDYLLFDGLNKNTFSHYLRRAQQTLELERLFTPHDLRHTYSTWLAEITGGNYTVCRMILGHSKLDMTMRYVHMNARIRRSMEKQQQLLRPMASEPTVPKSNVFSLPLFKKKNRNFEDLAS